MKNAQLRLTDAKKQNKKKHNKTNKQTTPPPPKTKPKQNKTHVYKILKTVGVQIIMLKHPAKHKKKKNTHKIHILYQRTQK